MQSGYVLLLFEDMDIKIEVIDYAIKLIKRIDMNIKVLLLLKLDFMIRNGGKEDLIRIQELKTKGEHALAPYIDICKHQNIHIRSTVMVGDPASELLKFIAQHRTLHSVIWGGEHEIFSLTKWRLQNHWMAQIKDKLGCPLIIPPRKET